MRWSITVALALALGCGEEAPGEVGPAPEVTLRAPDPPVLVGEEAEFRAIVVDDDIVEYRFAFGDGTPDLATTVPAATHSYVAAQWRAQARVTAEDTDGLEGSDSAWVVVYDPKKPFPCDEDDDCPDGYGCAEGACRPGGEKPACGPEETDCGGECRDLATDAGSCGECGLDCGEGESCVLSHCAVPGECAADADCGGDARCLMDVCIAIGDVVGSRALPFDGPTFGLAADGDAFWALDDPKPSMDLVRFSDEEESRVPAPGLDVGWYAFGLARDALQLVYGAYDDEPEASDLVVAAPDGTLAQRFEGAGGAAGEIPDGAGIYVMRPDGTLTLYATTALVSEAQGVVALDGRLPLDVAHDGARLWAIASDGGEMRLLAIDLDTLDIVRDLAAPPGVSGALAFDGEWLVAAGAERLYFIAP